MFLKAGFFVLSPLRDFRGRCWERHRQPAGAGDRGGRRALFPSRLSGHWPDIFWSINLVPPGQRSPTPPPPAKEQEEGRGRPGFRLHFGGERSGAGLHLRGMGVRVFFPAGARAAKSRCRKKPRRERSSTELTKGVSPAD